MKLLLVISFFVLMGSAAATLSTLFPYFFTPRPPTTPRPSAVSVTNTVRREFTHRTTDYMKRGKQKQKTRLSLQVSLGPMIFPESYEETTTPISQPRRPVFKAKSKPQPPPATTTELPDYEEYHESEEEILSEGFNPPSPRTTTTPKSNVFGFFKQLKDKFPSIHDWMMEKGEEDQEGSESNREARASKTFNIHYKKKQQKHHQKKTHKPSVAYGVPKKPKTILTPPKNPIRRPPSRRRPLPRPRQRPRQRPTPPAFETETDIQPAGQTEAPRQRRPPPKKQKPKPIRPTQFEQYPGQQLAVFEKEQDIQPAGQIQPPLSPPSTQYGYPSETETDIQPGGQTPSSGYSYPRPQEISKEIFFYEPPPQFAPSKPKPYIPKPPLPPKKQYKVIFIKAPEPEPPIIPDIPQIQPAPEQKTLIYVVAKKPEDPPSITVPAPVEAPTQKPDVVFIRYKVTTTTPATDETEKDIQPGGFVPKPKPGYRYPKPKTTTTPPPDETEDEVLPAGQDVTDPPDQYLPPDETEDEVLPGGQEPTDEYLPPDETEEEVLPAGQDVTEPNKEYLPGKPDESEEEVLPAGQDVTEAPPAKETEKEVLPAGQLPPPPSTPTYYPPPSPPPPSNQYLPQPPPSYGPQSQGWQNHGYSYNNSPPNKYGGAHSSSFYYQPPNTGFQNNYSPPQSFSFQNNYSPSQNSNFQSNYSPSQNSNYPASPSNFQTFPSSYNNFQGSTNYNTPSTSYNFGNHYSKPSYTGHNHFTGGFHKGYYGNQKTNSAFIYNSNNYVPKNVHTVQPPSQLSLPIYNSLHRQGNLDDDASLNSLLFSSLGLSPFP